MTASKKFGQITFWEKKNSVIPFGIINIIVLALKSSRNSGGNGNFEEWGDLKRSYSDRTRIV